MSKLLKVLFGTATASTAPGWPIPTWSRSRRKSSTDAWGPAFIKRNGCGGLLDDLVLSREMQPFLTSLAYRYLD